MGQVVAELWTPHLSGNMRTQSQAPCTHTSKCSQAPETEMELVTACFACLRAKEKVILTCKYLNRMYLLSFTTQTLYEWSILLMSLILYSLFRSDPMQPGFLPLPISWHRISQGHLQSPCHKFGSLTLGPLSLVLLPAWDSLLLGPRFSSTFSASQSYVQSPMLSPLLITGRTYLILWLLFDISRPTLLSPSFSLTFPVVYWTFPVDEAL